MTLNAGAMNTNIKMSLDAYIKDQVSGVSIDFEGLPFNDTETASWIQPRIIDINSAYAGHSSGTEYGDESNILFQVNIFVKKSGVTITHKHYQIRDIVAKTMNLSPLIELLYQLTK